MEVPRLCCLIKRVRKIMAADFVANRVEIASLSSLCCHQFWGQALGLTANPGLVGLFTFLDNQNRLTITTARLRSRASALIQPDAS